MLNRLPETNGVYLFKNNNNTVIYIGKSKNLRKRVKSYFTRKPTKNKTKRLLAEIDGIDYLRVSTELEALLLEDELIKKHLPKFNVKQKDFTKYKYFSLVDGEFPALVNGYKPSSQIFFGPFLRQNMARRAYEMITDNLRLRICKDKVPKNRCIREQLGFCFGPCFGKANVEEYSAEMQIALDYLKGEDNAFLELLSEKMHDYSEKLQFEKAMEIKEALKLLRGYYYRQEFFRQFSDGGVYVECKDNRSLSYLFYRGLLLGISNELFSKSRLDTILRKRLDKYKYIDRYKKIEKYDRANIVFTWLMKNKKKRDYIFL